MNRPCNSVMVEEAMNFMFPISGGFSTLNLSSIVWY